MTTKADVDAAEAYLHELLGITERPNGRDEDSWKYVFLQGKYGYFGLENANGDHLTSEHLTRKEGYLLLQAMIWGIEAGRGIVKKGNNQID